MLGDDKRAHAFIIPAEDPCLRAAARVHWVVGRSAARIWSEAT
jgi:hypothetical protein